MIIILVLVVVVHLQLALSTLCKPIIINTANQYLKIENSLEFDMNSYESIVLDEEYKL